MHTAAPDTEAETVLIVGAGVGGLCAAIRLASAGLPVTVLERAAAPGGKMREVSVAGRPIDAGPTVFTLRGVFDDLFAAAGTSLDDHVDLRPAEVLARHWWQDGSTLDLHADRERSVEAIGELAGAAEARRYARFCDQARATFEGLEAPFMQADAPSMLGFAARVGPRGLVRMASASPLRSLWSVLGDHFHDPRLRQLFGRYATYCGSSPFDAPATLLLIAHAELAGVWTVDGGMHRFASALASLAQAQGATIRYGTTVESVQVERGRASGVTLTGGERLPGRDVVLNADVGAIADGHFGAAVRGAVAPVAHADRSASAVTWCVSARASGFSLARHTVFFSDDYRAEFNAIRRDGQLPPDPTVYVCAQDRDDAGARTTSNEYQQDDNHERLLCLVNAPAVGDASTDSRAAAAIGEQEIDECEKRTFQKLARAGLTLNIEAMSRTTPRDFEALFPGTGGALYGRVSHGPLASFRRQGSRTKVPGLYTAGGSTHPSAGVPMAATSGRLAVEALLKDREAAAKRRQTNS